MNKTVWTISHLIAFGIFIGGAYCGNVWVCIGGFLIFAALPGKEVIK